MNTAAFITGLMKQNSDALGFIPATTIATRYVPGGQFVIQHDTRGRNVGYILHGKPLPGGILTIAQAVIDVDRRNLGFGEQAVTTLIDRAKLANCRQIVLHCAADLQANTFWQSCGFLQTWSAARQNRRQRAINTYVLDLWRRLL